MANCYKCGKETEQSCLWCRKPACKEHIEYLQGAYICKSCFKTTPDYQERKMKKIEEKRKKKGKKKR
ncbi:MAG: hypothetical protein ACTSQJ_15275 [Promethearchaeota archaeon]